MDSSFTLIEQATADTFRPLIGRRFSLSPDAGQPSVAELELTAVEDLPQILEGFRAPFSLEFRGSSAQPLGQALYWFHCESGEPLPIFIVPTSDDGNVRIYHASFN